MCDKCFHNKTTNVELCKSWSYQILFEIISAEMEYLEVHHGFCEYRRWIVKSCESKIDYFYYLIYRKFLGKRWLGKPSLFKRDLSFLRKSVPSLTLSDLQELFQIVSRKYI